MSAALILPPFDPVNQDHRRACLPERGQAEGEEGQTGERQTQEQRVR